MKYDVVRQMQMNIHICITAYAAHIYLFAERHRQRENLCRAIIIIIIIFIWYITYLLDKGSGVVLLAKKRRCAHNKSTHATACRNRNCFCTLHTCCRCTSSIIIMIMTIVNMYFFLFVRVCIQSFIQLLCASTCRSHIAIRVLSCGTST